MKLIDFYNLVVKFGRAADPRKDKSKIKSFPDSAILFGSPSQEIKKIMVGIDIEVTELLLADRIRQKEGLDLVIVDYLQLVSTAEKNKKLENRTVEVGELSRGLKRMAKNLNVPVIALSQINRNSEYRKDPRPILSDLRESGSIGQDASVVLMLYRESDTSSVIEVLVRKNRHGPTGQVDLFFHGPTTSFKDIPNPQTQNPTTYTQMHVTTQGA